MMEPSTDILKLAFTWSPRPDMQHDDPKKGFAQHLPVLRNILKCCDKYELHPECFLNGGLHYHAYLEIKDKIKWYKSVLPTFKRYGFVVIKKNPNEHWHKYIRKDGQIMYDVLEHQSLDPDVGLKLMTVRLCKQKVNSCPDIKKYIDTFIEIKGA